MKVLPVTLLNVFFHHGFSPPVRMGRLALSQRRIAFEYDPEFIGHSLELSPFKLPLQAGVALATPRYLTGFSGSSMTACLTGGGDSCSIVSCAGMLLTFAASRPWTF